MPAVQTPPTQSPQFPSPAQQIPSQPQQFGQGPSVSYPGSQPSFNEVARKKNKTGLIVLCIVLVLGVVSAAGVFGGAFKPNPLLQAVEDCDLSGADGVDLSDGDSTLSVDTEGEEDYYGASYTDFNCVVEALDTPTRITTRMDNTRALDGQLSDSANGLTYYWSYHPDSGVQLTVSRDQ